MTTTLRSVFAEPLCRSRTVPVSPAKRRSGTSESWKLNIAWNTGLRDGSCAIGRVPTSRSIGTSCHWCARPIVSCVRPTSSANDGEPSSRTRSGSVLTTMPIIGSISTCRRLATPLPMTTSSCPL